MSRSAHAQSTYELRKLPKCSRCNIEFILVLAQYEGAPKPVEEWECLKCKKTVPRELLREEEPDGFETFLRVRCEQLRKEDARRKMRRSRR